MEFYRSDIDLERLKSIGWNEESLSTLCEETGYWIELPPASAATILKALQKAPKNTESENSIAITDIKSGKLE